MFYGVLRDGASSSVPKRHTKTHVRTHKRIFHNQRGKFCRSKYKNSLIFLLRPQRGKQTAQYFPLKHSIKTRFHFHISTHSKLNSIKYKRKHHLSFFSPLKSNLRKKPLSHLHAERIDLTLKGSFLTGFVQWRDFRTRLHSLIHPPYKSSQRIEGNCRFHPLHG